jgi:hypothetical protein
MKCALTVYLVLLFTFCSFYTQAEAMNILTPKQTRLIDKEINKTISSITTTYNYESKLSRSQVLSFYRKLFFSQGLKDVGSIDRENAEEGKLIFQGKGIDARLFFYSSEEVKPTKYCLLVLALTEEAKEMLARSSGCKGGACKH